ncbi:Golgi integral membrane protein 4 isoform X2 [Diachasma alloeum]|uniref:Golgi integral membrane protein 4 isoform X2 n=1 Tax=Diachasma alloeum TaxID=454923 RepID=UPI00073817CD|nr:Golgi integral membrane protein 4 isoform X2 [Diachasma alloeum]
MSGSRLGRGRGGRLAIYGGCLVVMVLIVFLYRAATTEMTRLRDLHVQCAHQQEALAAQLQVIFEYKVRLEKSLAEEKNSNALAKQELQQRATREKSLRDKDSVEALQRFNSLQQQHKLLQSEQQDLKDECAKREKLALENAKQLESTLQDLRSQIRVKNKDNGDKEKLIESLKNKYFKLDTERKEIENKYNELIKNDNDRDKTIAHLNKEVFQLKRELDGIKPSCKTTSSDPSLLYPRAYQLNMQQSVAPKIASSRSQDSSTTSLSKQSIESSTRSIKKFEPSSTERPQLVNFPAAPMKQVSRLKLPMGVVPIPKMLEEKRTKQERLSSAENKNPQVNEHASKLENTDDKLRKQKAQKLLDNNLHDEVGRNDDGHAGEQHDFNQKDNAPWVLRVKPGFQEIGELNRDEKISELDDGRLQDVEEQDDDYREPPLGEEEQDEDDQIEDDQIKPGDD